MAAIISMATGVSPRLLFAIFSRISTDASHGTFDNIIGILENFKQNLLYSFYTSGFKFFEFFYQKFFGTGFHFFEFFLEKINRSFFGFTKSESNWCILGDLFYSFPNFFPNFFEKFSNFLEKSTFPFER